MKKLNKEAFKLVDEKADEIAKALLDSVKKGHVMSARLLVELAEADVDAEGAANERPLRTILLQLAQVMEAPNSLKAK